MAGGDRDATLRGGPAHARLLLQLLRDDDIDGAIDAGIADYTPCPALDGADNALILAVRERLLSAWAARDRHRARAARLARRATERDARRTAPGGGAGKTATTLPPAAAAALARARARVADRT